MGLAVAAGLIAGISNPANLNTMGDQDSQSKTMADMRILATAIEAYIAANGSAPKDLEGLTLEYLQEVPLKDAWGHDFIYETGEDSQSYTLLSLGEDGVEGGKDSKMDLVVEDGEFIAGPDIQR
jgi:type II secretory pathway pseudopilin PulG